MVYWINRDPVSDVLGAIDTLTPLGKPILPVGQAYDPSMDGQAYPNPTAGDLTRFMNAALSRNVASVSFWSWDAANQDQWSAIASFRGFDLGTISAASPAAASGQVAAIQRALKNVGRDVPVDGHLGPTTHDALAEFQRAKGLTPTGQADAGTVAALTKP
jgi:N-acetyl-anhydromuramyl-L-alanine amidase AmpD